MASVHSSREAAKLTTMLVDLPDMDDGTKIWIGAHTVGTYEWGWSDETRFTFTNWSPNEPNGYGYVKHQQHTTKSKNHVVCLCNLNF